MRRAVKKDGKKVSAYQLGAGSTIEQELLKEGVLIKRSEGTYEVFSQEAVHGTGEIAEKGDYIKIDEKGGERFPYPNERIWFETHHKWISDHTYEEIMEPVFYYQLGDPISPEIQQLMDSGKLRIDPTDSNRTFSAILCGTQLSVPADGKVILYGIKEDGSIDFNLIQAAEFERDYVEIST